MMVNTAPRLAFARRGVLLCLQLDQEMWSWCLFAKLFLHLEIAVSINKFNDKTKYSISITFISEENVSEYVHSCEGRRYALHTTPGTTINSILEVVE